MTQEQVLAVIRPGDTVLLLVPEDTDGADALGWAETLRECLPPECRVGIIAGDIRLAVVQAGPAWVGVS